MGFGYVSTFPRYFAKTKDGLWNEKTQESLDFLKQAREAEYGVVYELSSEGVGVLFAQLFAESRKQSPTAQSDVAFQPKVGSYQK